MTDERKTPAEDTAENEEKRETSAPRTARSTKNGRRRGRRGYAAPLGALISLLAVVGVAALVFAAVAGIRRATDTTALREELYYYLEPLMVYNPKPFSDITTEQQDAFLNAAAYKVVRAEQIRMLREGDENSRYPVDDQGRVAVPVDEMEASYRSLFGPDAPFENRTLAEDGLAYSESDACYYAPFEALAVAYRGVVDTVRRSHGELIVRIAYVAINDIKLDEHGNEIAPTPDQASYAQTYTLVKTDTGYYVRACADE